jgi:16S rRNA processing protein RimM
LGSEHVVVGRVGRPHGLHGAFFVDGPSEREDVFAVGAVLLAGGQRATVVSSRRGSGGRPVIRLDRAVERGLELAVERATLPGLEDDEFYVFQLVGLSVEEEDGRLLGRVRDVLEYPANDVLELDSGASLPLVEACVRQVDVAGGRIVVAAGFADPD